MNELIKQYKDPIIASFNFYLDYIYSLMDNYFEDGNLKPEFSADKQLEELISSCGANAKKYEKIRKKLINNDFNLSILEINYIGLMLFFWERMTQKQIATLQKASDLANNLRIQLLGNTKVDESQLINIEKLIN